MAKPAESYNDIAPTAFMAAYWRQAGSTPFAQEVFTAAEAIWTGDGHEQPDLDRHQTFHGPSTEARHLAGNRLLADLGIKQVLDLGAGLSSRGLELTEGDPSTRDVEVDLPIMSRLKQRVLERLGASALGTRYHLEAGSALDMGVIERAVSHFDRSQPIAVMSEGFLHYLKKRERAAVARNVAAVLRRFDGVWLTDLPYRPAKADRTTAPRYQRLGTGRNVQRLAFANRARALRFFARRGFRHTGELSYGDPTILSALTSPYNLGMSVEQVAKLQRPWSTFVLRLAKPVQTSNAS